MAALRSIITIGIYFAHLMTGHLSEGNSSEWVRFYEYIAKFEKKYNSQAELEERFNIYRDNLKIIGQLNRNQEDSAYYGETMFTDLTPDEFKRQFLLKYNSLMTPPFYDVTSESSIPSPPIHLELNRAPPFDSSASILKRTNKDFFSWIENNLYYPPVESQGQTKLCSVFAVVGALSILYSAQQRKTTSLSKQQYLDCNDSIMQKAGVVKEEAIFEYLKENCLTREFDYPYRENGEKRRCDKATVAEGVAGLEKVWTPGTKDRLKESLRKSPIITTVVGVNLQHYVSGMITHCPSVGDANLPVVIVEHGIEANRRGEDVPYYLLRTSWGPHYGTEQGHIKIKRDTCGIGRINYALKLRNKPGCFSGVFKGKNKKT